MFESNEHQGCIGRKLILNFQCDFENQIAELDGMKSMISTLSMQGGLDRRSSNEQLIELIKKRPSCVIAACERGRTDDSVGWDPGNAEVVGVGRDDAEHGRAVVGVQRRSPEDQPSFVYIRSS